jgi:hypothetical protein
MTDRLPDEVSPEHLSNILRGAGVLGAGEVRDVAVVGERPTLLSRIVRLRIGYAGPTDAPTALVLKTGLADRPESLAEGGRREVEFYREVAAAMATPPVPRCFEAHWDADPKAWHLVLEDLTDSHFIATTWPLPPTREQCERILGALARFHAGWWDHARLGVSVGRWLDPDAMNGYLRGLAGKYEAFADRLGDRLSAERRALYEKFLAAAPRLTARYYSHRHLAVVHGDAHTWNCFLPRDGGNDVRIFDWDAWRIGVPSNDLAYMMALHWYPERRQLMERALLYRYYAALIAHGVRGYSREALTGDYRFSTLWQLMVPVGQAAIELPPVIWWNHLERIMLAIDDLGCRALLD